MVITGFGAGSIFLADHLINGTPLARSLCGFIAVFRLARLSLKSLLLETNPYVTNVVLRWGERCLTGAFVYPLYDLQRRSDAAGLKR